MGMKEILFKSESFNEEYVTEIISELNDDEFEDLLEATLFETTTKEDLVKSKSNIYFDFSELNLFQMTKMLDWIKYEKGYRALLEIIG